MPCQENQFADMESNQCRSHIDENEFCIVDIQPIGCSVCITQEYFNGTSGCVRRASPGMLRCQDHQNQCAYCLTPECENHFILCERCSYSGEGNAAITEASFGEFKLCLYDRDMSPSEGWTCGCRRCIQVTTTFYTALYKTEITSDLFLLNEVIVD